MAALPTKLRATLAAIEAKAPRATVVVVPYLRVLPAVPVPCPPRVPMDTPTLAFLADVGTELQRALGAAAATANVDFVDTFAPEGHDACAKRRARWVEGARPVSALPFHPGAAGMKATAALIVASLASK